VPEVPEPYGIVVAASRNFDATWRKVKPQHLLHMPLQGKKKRKERKREKEKSSPQHLLAHAPERKK